MGDSTVTPLAIGRATPANITTGKTAAVSGTNYLIANDGNTRIYAMSTAGANLTVATPGTVDGLAITDLVVALTGTSIYLLGPFPAASYGTQLTVTVSANTDIAAICG